MKRLHQADAVRAVQRAADHERRDAEIVRHLQLRIERRQRRVDRRPPPGDSQRLDVVSVDLIERRVLAAPGITGVAAPFAVLRPQRRRRQTTDHHHETYGREHSPSHGCFSSRGLAAVYTWRNRNAQCIMHNAKTPRTGTRKGVVPLFL
jgi:hypothetical protein